MNAVNLFGMYISFEFAASAMILFVFVGILLYTFERLIKHLIASKKIVLAV